MRVFPVTIAAGEKFTGSSGTFLMLVATTDPVDISFFDQFGTNLDHDARDVEAGYKAHFPLGFSTFSISSTTTQTIRVGICFGPNMGAYDRAIGETDILSLPVVTVGTLPDWNKQYTEGSNFYSRGVNVAAVAAQYSGAQIWNKNSNTEIIALRKLSGSLSVGTSKIRGGIFNTAYSAYGGTLTSMSNTNRNNGGGFPVGEIYYNNNATTGNLITGAQYHQSILGNTINDLFDFSEPPILLGPGEGYSVMAAIVNEPLTALFTWSEH